MKLKNYFEITGIGSVPYRDEKKACDVVFHNFRRIPFWPQIVNKSFLEGMTAQFAERIPGIEVNPEKREVHINRSPDTKREIEDLERRCVSRDLEYFSISEDCASGFYEYLYRLKDHDNTAIDYLKGQITGPVSFGLSVSDEDKVPLFFDRELFEERLRRCLCAPNGRR